MIYKDTALKSELPKSLEGAVEEKHDVEDVGHTLFTLPLGIHPATEKDRRILGLMNLA